MNIHSRLKKLEMVAGNLEFCSCKGVKTETWRQDLTDDAETHEAIPMGEPVPEFCPSCRKPIEKQIFILQLVDESSFENFPGEMADERKATFNLKS